MKTLLFNGDLVSIGILTIVLIFMLAWVIYHAITGVKSEDTMKSARSNMAHTKSIGLFALIIGVLAQLIGLFSIFSAIEEAGDITPGMVISALKVSMIPILYGLSIYLLSLLICFILDVMLKNKLEENQS